MAYCTLQTINYILHTAHLKRHNAYDTLHSTVYSYKAEQGWIFRFHTSSCILHTTHCNFASFKRGLMLKFGWLHGSKWSQGHYVQLSCAFYCLKCLQVFDLNPPLTKIWIFIENKHKGLFINDDTHFWGFLYPSPHKASPKSKDPVHLYSLYS